MVLGIVGKGRGIVRNGWGIVGKGKRIVGNLEEEFKKWIGNCG